MTIIEKGSRREKRRKKKLLQKKVSGKGHKKNKGHLFFFSCSSFAFLCAVQKKVFHWLNCVDDVDNNNKA